MEGGRAVGAQVAAVPVGTGTLWIPRRWVTLLPVRPVRDLSPPLSAAALGTLDFSLLYDQENNALHCTISKAKVGRGSLPQARLLGAGLRRKAILRFLSGLGAGQGGDVCLNGLSCP